MRICPRDEGRIVFSARRSRYVGKGPSEGEQGDRLDDDRRSDDTSSGIEKCETHIDYYMYYHERRVLDTLGHDIRELRCYSQDADASTVRLGIDFALRQRSKSYLSRKLFL
jgi:hypothetical protein